MMAQCEQVGAHADVAAAGPEVELGDHDERAIVFSPTSTAVELDSGRHPSQLGKRKERCSLMSPSVLLFLNFCPLRQLLGMELLKTTAMTACWGNATKAGSVLVVTPLAAVLHSGLWQMGGSRIAPSLT